MKNDDDHIPRDRYDAYDSATEEEKERYALNRVVRLRPDDERLRKALDERFVLYFAQFKSSSREAEYFIHVPVEVLQGRVPDIELVNMPAELEVERFQTVVVGHERTLAHHVIRTMGVIDKERKEGGQVVIKEAHDS